MPVTVLLFASLKDGAGRRHLEVDLPAGAPLAQLKQHLAKEFPSIAPLLATTLASINQQYADDADEVPAGAEVAFFPPVSGGAPPATIIKVTSAAIHTDELLAQIITETTGAVCAFTGFVRGKTQRGEPHQTVSLEYEAYQPMAEAKMAQVADEIRASFPAVEGIVIVQRVGHLKPRTPTVMIACAAAHRDTGVFEAARYGIDRLKEIAPIWKKEIAPDGSHWVEGSYRPQKGE